MEQATRDNLKVQVLTERISQLVAQYEDQLANFRIEASGVIDEKDALIAELEKRLEENGEPVQEEADPADATAKS